MKLNTYHDWMIDRVCAWPDAGRCEPISPDDEEYPPSQKPGDWSLESTRKQIKDMTAGGQ